MFITTLSLTRNSATDIPLNLQHEIATPGEKNVPYSVL